MIQRGDTLDKVEQRLSTYPQEMKNKKHYDYIIRNNSVRFDDSIKVLTSIIDFEVSDFHIIRTT